VIKKIAAYTRAMLRPVPSCYGKRFHQTYEFLNESQWWPSNRLEEYQNEELRRLICHCYENVPYYRNLFLQHKLKPADIKGKKDLWKVPELTKEIVREHSSDLLDVNTPREHMEYCTTGGTSGTPLGIYIDRQTHAIRRAFEWRYYNWSEYRFGDKCVVLRGSRVADFAKGRRWDYDPINNYLLLSVYDMTPETMRQYIKRIREFRPVAVRGYPAALSILGQFSAENNLPINPTASIRVVFTSSETVFPFQRRAISEYFSAPVSDLYGNNEQAGRFGQCQFGQHYHDFSEYGIIEVADCDKQGLGEIIATSFTNYAMPLLRYKTGDFANRLEGRCECGRSLPLLGKVIGRSQDVAIASDGTPIPLTAYFFAVHLPEVASIRKLQIKQCEKGKLEIFIVKGDRYEAGQAENLFRRMNENLRSQFQTELRYVSEIPLTAAGKHRFFIQETRPPGEISSA